MADYYTGVSFIISTTVEQERTWLVEELKRRKSADEYGPGCQWGLEDEGLWLFEETGPDIEAIVAFCQAFLQKFDPKGIIAFEWGNFCSRPRTDGFGGGAAVVTVRGVQSMNTSDWIAKELKKLPRWKERLRT